MQTICDRCNNSVKKVGRLTNMKWRGVTHKLCRDCRRKVKLGLR